MKLSSRPDHLTRGFEKDLSGEGREVFAQPPAADGAFTVDEKEGPLGYPSLYLRIVVGRCAGNLAIHDAIRLDDVQRVITEEWVRQLQRLRERLLRKHVIGADAEDLDTEGLELLEASLPG